MPSATPRFELRQRAVLSRATAAVVGAVLLVVLLAMALGGLSLREGTPWNTVAVVLAIGVLSSLAVLESRARDAEVRELEGRIRQLQASEERLLAVLDNLEDSVVAVDTARRITACNDEFSTATENLAGVRAAVGVHFNDVIRPEKRVLFEEKLRRAQRGERSRELVSFETAAGLVHREISFRPLWRDGAVDGFTFEGRDVTARIEAERRLREANRRLVDLSRKAGMAQVANGILHEAGNVLNSINVAAGRLEEGLRDLPLDGVGKAAGRLEANGDPQLATYLARLHDLQKERVDALRGQARTLLWDIEHIKAVVAAQERRAGAAEAIEPTSLEEITDTAIDLYAERIQNIGITVERDYGAVGTLETDRHRVLQILGDVVNNACDALAAVQGERNLRVRTRLVEGEAHVEVEDDGIGIPADHLNRVFEHGFTTKRGNNGFSLHDGANAARQLGGWMSCTSDGPGRGARATLALPARPPTRR